MPRDNTNNNYHNNSNYDKPILIAFHPIPIDPILFQRQPLRGSDP